MAKININFNNKDYSIDEQSLSSASASLKSHLSTTMNGSGATISLGGTNYSIDSTKLTTARNSFVSHLGTISGNGAEVVVNGTKYSVDSTKLSGAMSELSTAFDNLSGGSTPDTPTEERLEGDGAEYYTLAPTALSFRSTAPLNELQEIQINGVTVDPSNYTLEEGSTIVTFPIDYLKTLDVGNYEVDVVSESKSVKGGFTVAAPELNEYGFYYNQPYMAYVEYFGGNTVFFIREGGVMDTFIIEQSYTERCSYIFENNTIVVSAAAGTFTGSIVENGIYVNELLTTFEICNDIIAADEDYIYKYYPDDGAYSVLSVINNTKSSYGMIKTGINGYPTLLIESNAFYYCENLESITIPSSIKWVREDAFWACSKLEEVIYEGCSVIDYGAYVDCPLTKGVIIRHGGNPSINKTYSASTTTKHRIRHECSACSGIILVEVEDCQFDKDGVCTKCGNGGAGLYSYYNDTGFGPDHIDFHSWTDIANEFAYIKISGNTIVDYNNTPGHLKIAKEIEAIAPRAFDGCNLLYSITIPDSVTSIGAYAFQCCTGLTSITIPDRVTSIEDGTFSGCTGLTSITIPDSVTSIGNKAFDVCTSLTSITIPDRVTSIGYDAFYCCEGLTDITFDGTIAQWNAILKEDGWNQCVPATYVQCTDGQVAL